MASSESTSSVPSNLIQPFLEKASKSLYNINEFECVTVIMGNETCDLDSVCCSIAYGVYFYDHYMRNSLEDSRVAIALMDIRPEDIQCKTEVLYWMKKLKVNVSNFVFRDQLDLFDLYTNKKLYLVLVDHHVLAPRYKGLEPAIKEIIDHRPLQEEGNWIDVDLKIKITGSCASLMTKKLIKLRKQLFTLQFAMLLYGPIVLDTAGLSPTSGRTTDVDSTMATMLETMYEECNREAVLRDLVRARADISTLTTALLLRKDLKFAGGVPIIGLPISIKKLLGRQDLEQSLSNFCERTRALLVVVMGQEVEQGSFQRSLGVYGVEGYSDAADKLIEFLQDSNDPDLRLELLSEESLQIPLFTIFSQGNDKASRKQVLPLVLQAISTVTELERMQEQCVC